MSGLEIIALVLNASDISFKVIAAAIEYGQKVRSASKQTEEIKGEVENTIKLLDDLHTRAEKAKESGSPLHQWPSLKDIDSKDSPVMQIKLELKIILDLLSTKKASKIEHLLWPRKAKKVEKSMQSVIKQREALVQRMMVDTGFQTIENDRRLSNMAKENKSSELQHDIEWISNYDHTVYHREASNECMETTGEWIFELADFLRWKNEQSGLLWVNGSAGSGKTILSSTIINHLFVEHERHEKMVVAYFYFKDGQRQEIHDMLQSIVKQICNKISNLPHAAISTIKKFRNAGERPNVSQLIGLLRSIAEGTGAGAGAVEIYILVDALDECNRKTQLLKSLVSILEPKLQNLHILVTSRDLVDIRRVLEPIIKFEIRIGSSEGNLLYPFVSFGHQSAGIENDIVLYIEQSMAEQHYLNIRSDKIKSTIKEKLVNQADGMFRWVACQIDQLSEPLSDEDLLQALDSLPKDLDETYERMLQNILIKKNNRVLAEMVRNLFKWLVASPYPLTLDVAAQAILQSPKNCSLSTRLPDLDTVLDICAGLVKAVEVGTNKYVIFVHFSVKEYLVSDRILESSVSGFALCTESSYRDYTKICISYILLFDQSYLTITELTRNHPLLLHACRNWKRHLRDADIQVDEEIINLAERLLNLNRQRFYIMSQSLRYDLLKWGGMYVDSQLHDAILCGLEENVKRLLQNGADPNQGMGSHGYPLHLAAMKKDEELIRLLINYKADVNLAKEHQPSALGYACSAGNRNLVQYLLDNGADPNHGSPGSVSPVAMASNHPDILQLLLSKGIRQEHSEAALKLAAKAGNEIAIDLLLDSNNDQNLVNVECRSDALLEACASGNERISQRLLNEGADVNHHRTGQTPLGNAVKNGYDGLVDRLLQHGANVNQEIKYEGSSVQIAVRYSNATIVRTLLEHGADPNCSFGWVRTPLINVINKNYPAIAELLLEFGADMHATTKRRQFSAFHRAVFQGQIDCVKVFFAHGVDYSREGGRYGPFLISAMCHKRVEMVDFLLDGESRTAPLISIFGHTLHGATSIGDEELVKSCLDNGDDANLVVNFRSPLSVAVDVNRISIANLLLERGANVNFTGDCDDNALHNAATKDDEDAQEMCILLLDHGASINRVQGKYDTPLKAAIINANKRITKLLLERGADINLSEGKYGSPLSAAFSKDTRGTTPVDLLLEHGADPNYHGGECGSVLQAACYKNSSPKSTGPRQLLDAGADINYSGGGHPSPIEIAHGKKDKPLLETLLLRGADVPQSLVDSELLDEVRNSWRSDFD